MGEAVVGVALVVAGVDGSEGVDGGPVTLDEPPCSFSAMFGTGRAVGDKNCWVEQVIISTAIRRWVRKTQEHRTRVAEAHPFVRTAARLERSTQRFGHGLRRNERRDSRLGRPP